MQAHIYQPARNAMQSGRAKTENWVLEYDGQTRRAPGGIMGWTTADNTLGEVRMTFATRDDAEAYARKHGLEYTVSAPHERVVTPVNYVDNFKSR